MKHSRAESLPSSREETKLNRWQRFNITFWILFLLPVIVNALSDNFLDVTSNFLTQIGLALGMSVAMTIILARYALQVKKVRSYVVPYVLLGLLPLGLGLLIITSGSTGVGGNFSRLLPERLAWASWLIPGAISYLLAYGLLFRAYASDVDSTKERPDLLAPLMGIVILVIIFGIVLNVPAASDGVLRQYFAGQSNIASYQVESTTWSHHCCAESILSTPRQANAVRYVVQVRLENGQSENETIDLYDSRSEDKQFDDEMGLGGHQKWKVEHVYKPGETPPAVVWDT